MVAKLPDESDQDYAALQAWASYNPRPDLTGTGLAAVASRNRWTERLAVEQAIAPIQAMTAPEAMRTMAQNLLLIAFCEVQTLTDQVQLARTNGWSKLKPKETIELLQTLLGQAQAFKALLESSAGAGTGLDAGIPAGATVEERAQLRALSAQRASIVKVIKARLEVK